MPNREYGRAVPAAVAEKLYEALEASSTGMSSQAFNNNSGRGCPTRIREVNTMFEDVKVGDAVRLSHHSRYGGGLYEPPVKVEVTRVTRTQLHINVGARSDSKSVRRFRRENGYEVGFSVQGTNGRVRPWSAADEEELRKFQHRGEVQDVLKQLNACADCIAPQHLEELKAIVTLTMESDDAD